MNKIYSLQVLRAFACVLVLVEHFLPYLPYNHHRINGTIGVDLFFVISGFIIAQSIDKLHEKPFLNFSISRFSRVIPYYFLITAFGVFFRMYLGEGFSVSRLLYSVTFIPGRGFDPVIPQGWSLNHEIFFYSFTAFCLLFTPNLKVIAVSFFCFITIFWVISDPVYLISFFRCSMNYTFLAGIVIYIAKERVLLYKIGIVSLVIGLFLLTVVFFITSDHQRDLNGTIIVPTEGYFRDAIYFYRSNLVLPRFFVQGITSILLFVGVMNLEKIFNKRKDNFLIKIGNASYSIYLVQFFFLGLMWKLNLHSYMQSLGWMLLTIIVSLYFVKIENYMGKKFKIGLQHVLINANETKFSSQ